MDASFWCMISIMTTTWALLSSVSWWFEYKELQNLKTELRDRDREVKFYAERCNYALSWQDDSSAPEWWKGRQ